MKTNKGEKMLEESKIAEIRKLLKDGVEPRDVATTLNVSPSTVYYYRSHKKKMPLPKKDRPISGHVVIKTVEKPKREPDKLIALIGSPDIIRSYLEGMK